MDTKWISTPMVLLALCCCITGCANNRFQHQADKSLLIQENLQLDQALSITQYELMLAQQENDVLREQLEQMTQNSGSSSGSTSGGMTGGRTTTLRSQHDLQYEQAAPAFDAYDPSLPPPSNQVPQFFQRPLLNPPPDYPTQSVTRPGRQTGVVHVSGTQYANTPPGAPQWSPQRVR